MERNARGSRRPDACNGWGLVDYSEVLFRKNVTNLVINNYRLSHRSRVSNRPLRDETVVIRIKDEIVMI